MHPENLKYTRTHEWVKIEQDTGVIGITKFGAEELADIVYIELPAKGEKLKRDLPFGTIESVKAVVDLNAPVSGEVMETHADLLENLDSISSDPYGEGWLVKIKLDNPNELDELLNHEQYAEFVKKEKEK